MVSKAISRIKHEITKLYAFSIQLTIFQNCGMSKTFRVVLRTFQWLQELP